jgi:hypothetical protein
MVLHLFDFLDDGLLPLRSEEAAEAAAVCSAWMSGIKALGGFALDVSSTSWLSLDFLVKQLYQQLLLMHTRLHQYIAMEPLVGATGGPSELPLLGVEASSAMILMRRRDKR